MLPLRILPSQTPVQRPAHRRRHQWQVASCDESTPPTDTPRGARSDRPYAKSMCCVFLPWCLSMSEYLSLSSWIASGNWDWRNTSMLHTFALSFVAWRCLMLLCGAFLPQNTTIELLGLGSFPSYLVAFPYDLGFSPMWKICISLYLMPVAKPLCPWGLL